MSHNTKTPLELLDDALQSGYPLKSNAAYQQLRAALAQSAPTEPQHHLSPAEQSVMSAALRKSVTVVEPTEPAVGEAEVFGWVLDGPHSTGAWSRGAECPSGWRDIPNARPIYTRPQQSAGAPPKPERAWLPIETAPKDSSRILIYTPRSSRKVQEAWWAIQYEGALSGYWSTPHGPQGRGYTILPEAATHWQPLPPPPSAEEPKL